MLMLALKWFFTIFYILSIWSAFVMIKVRIKGLPPMSPVRAAMIGCAQALLSILLLWYIWQVNV